MSSFLRDHFTVWPLTFLQVQGVQDQKCQKERPISQEGNTFDPTLVKLKCV